MSNENIPAAAAPAEPLAFFADAYTRPDTAQFHQYQLRAKDSPNHCGPFSTAMAVNMLLGEHRLKGEDVAETLTREFIGWYPEESLLPRINRFPPKAFTFPGAIAGYLNRTGIAAKAHRSGTLDELRQCVLAGRIPAVLHGEPLKFEGLRWKGWSHWKLVVGFTPTHFLFQDPWFEIPDPAPGAIEEFDRYWANMGRAWVEIG